MRNSKSKSNGKGKYAIVGGESLGEGTYGCVISSGVTNTKGSSRCAKLKNHQYKVAKIFIEFDRALEEYRELDKLQHIKDIDKYAILPKDMCAFSFSELSPEDRRQLEADCPKIRDAKQHGIQIEDYDSFGQLFYAEKGVTLSSYWRNQTNVDVDALINHFVHLSKGIEAFVNNKFIHYDIKPGNIIVTDTDSTAKFIDFGLSMSFEDFANRIGPEMAKYPYWPPEVYYNIPLSSDYHYHRIDYGRNDTANAMNRLKKVFKPESQYFDEEAKLIDNVLLEAEKVVKELPTPKEKDQRLIDPFFRKPGAKEPLFTKDQSVSILTNIYQPMLERIDVFSLGVTLKNILDIVQQNESVKQDAAKLDRLNKLQQIVQLATKSNPFERPHPKQLAADLLKQVNRAAYGGGNKKRMIRRSNKSKKKSCSK